MGWWSVGIVVRKLVPMRLFIVVFVGALLYEDCGCSGLCSSCAELWEAEIDLEDEEDYG